MLMSRWRTIHPTRQSAICEQVPIVSNYSTGYRVTQREKKQNRESGTYRLESILYIIGLLSTKVIKENMT